MKYVFYANCIPIVGYKRVSIIDLQRDSSIIIPKELYSILQLQVCELIYTKINGLQNTDNVELYQNLLEYMEENEIIFKTDEAESFPTLNLDYYNPSIIDNFIIDIKILEHRNFYISIFNQLEKLGCNHIQVRFFSKVNDNQLIDFFSLFKDFSFQGIEIILPFTKTLIPDFLINKINEFDFIFLVVVYNSPFRENYMTERYNKMGNLIYLKEDIPSEAHCGNISPNNFMQNLKMFSESQKYNTCLNRKISIDVNGEIKNCPSMTKSYGNIKDTTLREAIEKAGFKDVWNINKDQIEICKDCEFRHICTDCRAYIQDPNNIYSKPAKCGYDPYTATWGEENPTNNPLYGQ